MKKISFFLISLLLSTYSFCDGYLDSLNILYKTLEKDTLKYPKLLINISDYYLQHDIEEAKKYSKEGLKFAKEYNSNHLTHMFNNQTAITFAVSGNNDSAMYYFMQFLSLDTSKLTSKELGSAYNNLGILFSNTGEFEKSLENHLIGLNYRQIAKDTGEIAASMNNIGLIFYREKKLDKAERYFKSTISLLENNNAFYNRYANLMLNAHNNLGLTYNAQNKTSESIKEYQISLEIGKKNNFDYHNAYTLQYLGEVLIIIEEYDKALNKLQESLKITRKIGDTYGEKLALKNIADVYYKTGKYNDAIEILDSVSRYYEKIGDRNQEQSTYFDLSHNYYSNNQYKLAYDNLLRSYSLKDSIFNKDSEKALAEMETKYATAQKENEILELNKTKEIQEEKLRSEKKQRIGLIGGLILLLGLSISIFRSYSLKKQANIEVQAQRDEANKQKLIVEEKNKEITDSITYAKRIQETILPHDELIKSYFKNSFIFYKPKDIVSGDFYWFNPIENEVYFAVVDCTGHGVPGAFMSIIGNNGLNKAIQEERLSKPSVILDYLNHFVQKSLMQGHSKMNDGMDVALCKLNLDTLKLEYSGAYNPLIVIRNNEIIEVKANRFSIGSNNELFSNHIFQLEQNDSIFIYSDGFADQFGGDEGKKYSSKKLKQLFKEISNLPSNQQFSKIENTFSNWTKNEEQLDDICIFGINV